MTDKNDERTVRCPVEGCDSTPLARGINLHIMRSSGDGHGPRGEVPDSVSLENLKTVGEREVEMDYPEERNNEKHARLCPYCSQTFAGIQGLMIHLGQTAGRKNHPANPKDRHEPSDFPRVEVDAEGNVQQVAGADDADHADSGKGAVPTARVFRLIADLIADGETRTAHRVRRALLGADDAVAPSRDEPAHPELFEALLTQGRAEQTDHRVTAALEGEGVMVACRGESAFLSAPEARDVAARLEQVAASEDWRDDDTRDLIAFLRHGADVLDGDETERGLHEEFDHWR
ncbi:hypothetical protein GOC83_03620 [Haloarcula rubripromontorii]|uniref:Uncharacterized protein n=1 Tax=Haloarcula rubripromontorii TaxID=1705562 RepID=A0A847TXE6_9EURY|nr:hypothetical protein [Haloarcula rubripromontorii]NLV05226.1 hypothetical protein [Haloarcula rubripromontorii]